MKEVVTAAVLADLYNVSTRTIGGYLERGIAVRGPGGKGFDLRATTRAVMAHLRAAAANRAEPTEARSAAQERARLARVQADKVELQNASTRGALLDSGAVQAEWSDILRQVRAGMLAVPSRSAARLPHLTAHDVSEIDQEVRAALAEVGGEMKSVA